MFPLLDDVKSCQAQNPAFGKPSGFVPLGLSTTIWMLSPATPKCCAAVTASAARSAWVADCGAALPLSTQEPASTDPPNEGPWPLLSVYCELIVDQLSPDPPSPATKFCMYCWTPLESEFHWLPQK